NADVLTAAGNLLDRNSPARSDIALVVDAPHRPAVLRVREDQTFLRIDGDLSSSETSGFRSSNDAQWLGISFSGPIEDQQAITLDDQKIVNRIDGHLRCGGTNLRIGSGEDSLRGHIAIRHAIKNDYALGTARSCASISTRSDRKENFVVFRIGGHCAESRITHAEDAGLRPLDDANGRFFSIGRSFEREDRLCQRAVDDDFVVNPVIRETMHRSAEQRFLTFERSYRWFVFLRLTGESRNLRMGHSVRDPYL